MAIDFDKPVCISKTNEKIFGICDDPPPPPNPAYLDYNNSDKWIAWVENDSCKSVTFTAIDHCVDILPDTIERCDGMLHYDDTIIFVELKDRDSGRWLGKGRDQLISTIDIYKNEVGLNGLSKFYAFVSNKQRPTFNAATLSLAEEFDDKTGFVLQVKQVITIY